MMKKIALLMFGMLFALIVAGQSNLYILNEDFIGNDFPEGWTKAGVGTNNWYVTPSFGAGGTPNEMQLSWTPWFNGTARFVSPEVDMTEVNSAMLSLDVYVVIFSGNAKIGVATSSDGGTTWNDVWSENYTATEQKSITQNISSPDMGKQNVKFCFYFEGNSSSIQSIYFDNFKVYTVENIGIEMLSIDVPEYIAQGENAIDFTVKNIGETAIKSFEARCIINDEVVLSETFYSEINYLDSKQFTFEDPYEFAFGEDYDIEIEIFRVNDDDLSTSSSLTKTIGVAMYGTQRTPMIEHFSSSTCDPCVAVNNSMAELTDNNKGKYTYTKYTVNGPGTGDPYYTDEVGTKMSYYGVNSVPQVYFDGMFIDKTSINDVTFNSCYDTPALANVRGAFKVEGNTINVIADFMTYFNAKGIKAYISVNEKTTTNNVGTNGEKEFHHVMMKMLNDDKGTELDINAGEYQRLKFSYDMSTTFMEDIDDLEVALWLQNEETKEIYNSHFAYAYTDHCYPVRNINVFADNKLTVKWEKPEAGNPVGYNVYLNGKLAAEKISSLEYSTSANNNKYVEVVAVYENDMTSVGVAKEIVAGDKIEDITENNISIYPNPANDRLYIEAEAEIEETVVYDIYGKAQNLRTSEPQNLRISINVSELNAGIYFIKINTNERNIVKQFIKN